MRTARLSFSLLALAACSGTETLPPADTADWLPARLTLAELAGATVTATSDGPWQIRRTARSTEDRDFAMGVTGEAAPSAPSTGAGELSARAPADAPPTEAGPLRAGSTDDNADYEAFLDYLDGATAGGAMAGRHDPLDVRDRRYVRVVSADGAPLPGAKVRIVDTEGDRIVWWSETYGDGRAPFYPHVAGVGLDPAASWLVEVRHGEHHQRARWNGSDDLEVTVEGATVELDPVRLEVLFLIDTTGSMGDEIARIKASLLKMTERLRGLDREFDLRYGAVLYRDIGDDYVTSRHPFTDDIAAFDDALKQVEANGGGDGPESLNQGLAVAVDDMDWRGEAAKLAFLIADAPPHMDYEGDVGYGTGVRTAVAKGIKVHAVAASGLDRAGTLVFRQIAQFTRGKFIFIEYGSTESSAAAHGVTGKVDSNNLDAIMYQQVADELARWGR